MNWIHGKLEEPNPFKVRAVLCCAVLCCAVLCYNQSRRSVSQQMTCLLPQLAADGSSAGHTMALVLFPPDHLSFVTVVACRMIQKNPCQILTYLALGSMEMAAR